MSLATGAFTDTVTTFSEFTDDEILRLVPGHAYWRSCAVLPASRLRDSRTASSRGSTTDHGDPLQVRAHAIGASGERWVEPFLQANASSMQRMSLQVDVCADSEVYVRLTPGARIGAVPLVGPATRRVVAGILVEPRFRWPALVAVFNSIGFIVEPALGGSPLVPGSAREVPPWILAGPVIQRVAALLRHGRRSFVEHQETRSSPRGRVLWPTWISTQLPRGAWTQFPCRYSEPESDPGLLANARWTLSRLMEELSRVAWSPPGRFPCVEPTSCYWRLARARRFVRE